MTLRCPRCRTDLQERPAHELVIHGCVRCGGVWLDRDGVARLGEALSGKTLAAVDSMTREASQEEEEARPIDCPVCAEILIRRPVPAAGVAIDRCPEHGAWYDRNELQKVARALGSVPVVPPVAPVPAKPVAPPTPVSSPTPVHTPPVAPPTPVPSRALSKSGKKSAAKAAGKKTPPKPAVSAPAASAAPADHSFDGGEVVSTLAGLLVDVALSFL